MGQLVMVLRAKYLVDAQGYNKIQGKPFKTSEIERKIEQVLAQRKAVESARVQVILAVISSERSDEVFSRYRAVNGHRNIAGLHQKRFSDRPGNPLVPGLRRLRHSLRRAVRVRRARRAPRKFRVHFRHRLLQPLPVLHEHVRLPHHSRTRAGHRHRPENHAVPISTSGWSPATAIPSPSAAITPFTCCAATSA